MSAEVDANGSANRSHASSSRSSWSRGHDGYGTGAHEVDLNAFAAGSGAYGHGQQVGMGITMGVGMSSSRGYGSQKMRWWEAEELGARERKVL